MKIKRALWLFVGTYWKLLLSYSQFWIFHTHCRLHLISSNPFVTYLYLSSLVVGVCSRQVLVGLGRSLKNNSDVALIDYNKQQNVSKGNVGFCLDRDYGQCTRSLIPLRSDVLSRASLRARNPTPRHRIDFTPTLVTSAIYLSCQYLHTNVRSI